MDVQLALYEYMKRFQFLWFPLSLLCGLGSTKLFAMLQLSTLPPPKTHLMLSPASPSAQRVWAGPSITGVMGDMESCWALSAPPECRTSKDLAQVSWLMLFFHALCIEAALVVFPQKCSLVIILKLQGEDWPYFMLLLFFPKVIFQFGKKKKVKPLFFPQCETLQHTFCWCHLSTNILGWRDIYWWHPQKGETFEVGHSIPRVLFLNTWGLTSPMCRNKGQADKKRKELCIAEEQVVQLEAVWWAPPAGVRMCGWS